LALAPPISGIGSYFLPINRVIRRMTHDDDNYNKPGICKLPYVERSMVCFKNLVELLKPLAWCKTIVAKRRTILGYLDKG
jgi:hypothetical protein